MSTTVVVAGQPFKRRNPVAVWVGLPLITLGIYYFVWWYKINDEARRFLRDDSIRPALSLLAVTVGSALVVPPFVSIYRTTERIAIMQGRAGLPPQGLASPWVSVLLTFVFGLNRLYLQMELNRIWDGYARAATPGIAAPSSWSSPPPPAAPPGMPPPPPVPQG